VIHCHPKTQLLTTFVYVATFTFFFLFLFFIIKTLKLAREPHCHIKNEVKSFFLTCPHKMGDEGG
jgi:hypothetical protein